MHVHTVLRASSWSDSTYHYYIEEEKKVLDKDLNSFIHSVYRQLKVANPKFKAVIHHSFDVSDSIIAYAKKNGYSYICISARGAGTLVKIFGTVTGALITGSEVPVICIPKNYKTKPITRIMYASDLTNYEDELKQVIDFAKPLKAEVEMLHLSYPFEIIADEALLEQSLKKKFRYPVDLYYQKRDLEESVLDDIETAVQRSAPSIVAMFTRQKTVVI